jgi:predicted GNAT superfamily acetyltransferase
MTEMFLIFHTQLSSNFNRLKEMAATYHKNFVGRIQQRSVQGIPTTTLLSERLKTMVITDTSISV